MTLVNEMTIAGDIVISTVPSSAQKQIIGMIDTDQGNSTLLDIAYNPWPSDLAKYWTAHQLGSVLSGVEMLLWQACAQVELFTGAAAPVEAMRAALPSEFSTA